MGFSHFFIARPIFAAVVALVITIIGAIGYTGLGVTQLPEITPPTITVTTNYPGASAQTVADTVAAPIEQEINGVENMIYMASQSTSDGNLSLTVTFEVGTDIDRAQVLVQNRVSAAERRLPDEVRRNGLTVRKRSPDLLLAIHLISPDSTYDQVYISNYGLLNVRDRLMRLYGVADVFLFGVREYSMRIWLDPERIAARDLTAEQVLDALARAERAGGGRVAGRAAGRLQERLPDLAADEGPAQERGRVREHHRQERRRWPRGAAEGRRARRARGAELQRAGLRRPVSGRHRRRRPAAGLQRGGRHAGHQGHDGRAGQELSQGARVPHHLQPDRVHRGLDQEALHHHPRGHRAGRAGGAAVPQDLARHDHSRHRHPGVAGRHLRGDAGVRLLAQHAHPVRAGAVGRHRRRRRHRRGGERRAQAEGGPHAARGGARLDGRGGHRAHRHRPGAAGGVHSDRLHRRHHRPVLPPVRDHDRDRDRHLAVPVADLEPGAVRAAVQAARRSREAVAADGAGARLLPPVRPRLRCAGALLRLAGAQAGGGLEAGADQLRRCCWRSPAGSCSGCRPVSFRASTGRS